MNDAAMVAIRAMINGHLLPFLLWLVNILLGFIIVLLSLIFREHQKQDEKRFEESKKDAGDHRARIEEEIKTLRKRSHEYGNLLQRVLGRLEHVEDEKGDGR